MIKKVFGIGVVMALCVSGRNANATYTVLRDASSLTRGTLDPARLPAIPTNLIDTIALANNVKSNLGSAFNIVVGTAGALGVDMRVATLADFNAVLSSIGAAGLTNSTTGFGTIVFKSGVYSFAGATIPAGVTVMALPGSSVVWKVTDGTQQLVRVYGTLDGFKFDLYGQGIASQLIDLKSGSRFTNFDIYGASQTPTNNNTYKYATISVQASSGVTVQGLMREFYLDRDVNVNEGENALVKIYGSTDVYVSLEASALGLNGAFGVNNVFTLIHARLSRNIRVNDGDYKDMPATIFLIGVGSSDIFFERNKINITTFCPTDSFGSGLVSFENRVNFGLYSTTGTISISYNNIVVSTAGPNAYSAGGNFIWIGSNAGGTIFVNGVVVRNNTMTLNGTLFSNGPSRTVFMRFATIAAQSNNSIFQDNYVGCGSAFISDSGNGTLSASLGNIFKGVQQ